MSNAEGSDPPTAAIPRDRLLALVKESSPLPPPSPHLIARGTRHPIGPMDESMEENDEGVSPLAVFAVFALFVALFVAVLQLG